VGDVTVKKLNTRESAAAALISELGIEIKEGPYYRLKVATRPGRDDVHLFRVRAVIGKDKAAELGLTFSKKEDWSRERSLRFIGTVVDEALVSVKAIGPGARKRASANASKYRKKPKRDGPVVYVRPRK